MSDIKTVNKPLKTAIFNIKRDFGLKQSEIAGRLGIKSTYLSDMINGGVPFSESISKKIYEVFQVRVEKENSFNLLNETPTPYGNYCKRCEQKDKMISELWDKLQEKDKEKNQLCSEKDKEIAFLRDLLKQGRGQEEKSNTG